MYSLLQVALRGNFYKFLDKYICLEKRTISSIIVGLNYNLGIGTSTTESTGVLCSKQIIGSHMWQLRRGSDTNFVKNFAVISHTKPCSLWCCTAKQQTRFISTGTSDKDNTATYYIWSAILVMFGLTFASVPLYKIFCQTTGFGGTPNTNTVGEKIEKMKPLRHRLITVTFGADISSRLAWKFKPQQKEVVVSPGETALVFYTAYNPTDVPIVGISSYNILPYAAGKHFNKIQCFCFEEQRLNPHEKVDMPVFFYIDPEFNEDPDMEFVKTVTLSYTFFEAKDGFKLPVPNFLRMKPSDKIVKDV